MTKKILKILFHCERTIIIKVVECMRFRTIICLFISCFIVMTTSQSNAEINLLQNPGFEELGWPPAYWNQREGGGGASGYISDTVSHTGSQSAVRELYGSGTRWGGYSQDVAISAGQVVTASGWLMSSSSDSPLWLGKEIVKYDFLNSF